MVIIDGIGRNHDFSAQRLDVPEFHDDVVNHYGRFDEEFLVVGIHLPVRVRF